MQAQPLWKRVLTPLRFILSGGLLAYLVLRADPATIWAIWRDIDLRLLLLAVVLQLLGVAVSAYKWSGLLRSAGKPQPYLSLLSLYLVGQFASNFLPTAVGGDAIRIVQLGRRIGSFSEASASIFVERLTGFLALSLTAILAILVTSTDLIGRRIVTESTLSFVATMFGLAAIIVAIGSFSAPRLLALFGGWLPAAIRAPLATIAEAVAAYGTRRAALIRALVISFAFHICWICSHLVCGVALAIAAPPLLYALMVPLTDIVGLVPVFVNNIGARDLVFTLYLGQVGVPAAAALALAFVVFSVRLAISALGGLVTLFGGADVHVSRAEAEKARRKT